MSGPCFNPDDNFLVITKRAADAVRYAANDPSLNGNDVRSAVVYALHTASHVTSYDGQTGPTTILQAVIFHRVCLLEIVQGLDISGKPRLAPDGKKTMAFLSYVRVKSSHGIIAKRWGLR